MRRHFGADGRIALQHVGDIRAENVAEIAAAMKRFSPVLLLATPAFTETRRR